MARREWNVVGNGHFGRLAKSAGVRRNPHEYAGTGAIGQEKTPTENGWGSILVADGRPKKKPLTGPLSKASGICGLAGRCQRESSST